MECRGVVGLYEPRTDAVTIWSSTQVVHWVRREAATVLQLPEARIRCVALDVGGGFGLKGHVYPEDLLIPFLARKLGRPVQWIEDRREHLMCSCHSRDQLHDVEIGFDNDGRILALRDDFIVDCGAWNPIGAGVVYNTAVHLPGPYKIDVLAVSARIGATNKVPNAPYRGAGRPEAAFAMERAIDLVAGRLGLEPADVRLRNMIGADEMPYRVGIPYRDGEPIVLDSGDYPGALRKALAAIGGVAAFRQRQQAARKAGRYLGLGLGCYVEGTGVGPFESAMVRIDPSGKVYVSGGSCPQGQGMETIFAQVVADTWAVTPDDVVMTLADTSAIAVGFGTIASRSTVTLSAAIHGASDRRQSAGMLGRGPRAASRRRRHRRRAGLGGLARQGGAGLAPGLGPSSSAGPRRRIGRDILLRAADGDLVLCGACRGDRGRCRARAHPHREIRHRPRLRRGGQPDAGRRAGRRRRRARHRRRDVRGVRLQFRRPADDRLVHGLHAADRL
jgi:carbon-monoxide dehydrogenase large subunit